MVNTGLSRSLTTRAGCWMLDLVSRTERQLKLIDKYRG